nr:hypothetical transcript [Hymenolepis microstoma]
MESRKNDMPICFWSGGIVVPNRSQNYCRNFTKNAEKDQLDSSFEYQGEYVGISVYWERGGVSPDITECKRYEQVTTTSKGYEQVTTTSKDYLNVTINDVTLFEELRVHGLQFDCIAKFVPKCQFKSVKPGDIIPEVSFPFVRFAKGMSSVHLNFSIKGVNSTSSMDLRKNDTTICFWNGGIVVPGHFKNYCRNFTKNFEKDQLDGTLEYKREAMERSTHFEFIIRGEYVGISVYWERGGVSPDITECKRYEQVTTTSKDLSWQVGCPLPVQICEALFDIDRDSSLLKMNRTSDVASISQDLYIPNETSIGSVPAPTVSASILPPPRPTSSPSAFLPATSLQSYSFHSFQQSIHSIPPDEALPIDQIPTPTEINELSPDLIEDSAMAQLLESVDSIEGLSEPLPEDLDSRDKFIPTEPKVSEPMEIPTDTLDDPLSKQSSDNLDLANPSPPIVTSAVLTVPTSIHVESGASSVKSTDEIVEKPPPPHSMPSSVTPTAIPSLVRVVSKRKSAFSSLDMIKAYAATLQPVDCVILMERCAPFSGSTKFMNYFKSEYLSKLLCDLNGGPPVDTEFGRDAYTNLYSLHTFDWHKPEPSTPQVSDTAIIKSLFNKIEELKPRPVPPLVSQPDEGTPVIPLLRSALAIFDHLDTFRRRALGKGQRRRHLILVLRSPLVSLDQLDAEAAVLSGEIIADNTSALSVKDGKEYSNGSQGSKDGVSETGSSPKGVLARLRELLVAVSIFSPIEDKGFRKLAMLCNMLKPDIKRDNEWPTVIFSRELSQISLAQRPNTMATAATQQNAPRRTADPQAKRFQQPQSGYSGQQMGGAVMGIGNKEPSPRQLLQQPLQGHQQGGQQQMNPYISQQHQQQVPQGVMHHMGGGIDSSAPSQHQPRMPVSFGQGSNSMMAAGGGNQQTHHQHGSYSGPNSIEPPVGHQQQMQQLQPGMQRTLSSASAGPGSVPDTFGGSGNVGFQPTPANQPSLINQGYGLAPPSMAGTENQGVRPPAVPQQQQQYYSTMPQTPYENEGALTGLSPAVAPDQYLRVNYPSNASPMCPNPNINASTGDSQAPSTSLPVLQNPSPSQPQPQQQAKQQQTPQHQPQSQPSPYAAGSGTPHSGEQGNVQYHMRQHASPYQASQQQQQSPMAAGSQMLAAVQQQQQYHTSTAQAYSMPEVTRFRDKYELMRMILTKYTTSGGGSPMNTMRTSGQGQASGAPQGTPSAQQQPASGRIGGVPGGMVPTGEERAIIWEGQLSLGGQIASYVQISADVNAPRLSYLWHNNSRLMMQMELFDRESHWGQVLIHRAPSFIHPTQLSIGFKSSENQAALQSRFQSPSPSSFTVAIVPPLNSFGQIPSGCIAFICLLCVGDNHFVGLVPRNAETFRDDIVRRQMHRRQQPQQASQQQQQYDTSLLEMQSQQILQQQQPSPAYSVNTPSMPNTPNKGVRPTTVTPSPVLNRVGSASASAAGMPPQQRIPSLGGMVVEDVADPQQQQFISPLTANIYPQQMAPQVQPQGPPPQQQQIQRQPSASWQQQERPQPSVALPPEMMQQQQQRAYQSYQQPQPQQTQQIMSGGQPSQQQQQHIYHQGQSISMGQSSGFMQQQQRMPQGQPRPQGGYPGGGIPQPRQQLRDVSGRFQSTSNPAAAMASGNPEYHNAAAAAAVPLPPAYTSNPMYEMSHAQQYGGQIPTQQQRMTNPSYTRPSQPGPAMGMRGGTGYAAPGGPRMTAAGYPTGRGVAMGARGGMVRMRGTVPAQQLMMGEAPPGLIYEGSIGIIEQGQAQPQQGVFDPNMQPQPPQNQPNLFD